MVGGHPYQRALKAAYVGANPLGQKIDHLVRHLDAEGDGLIAQDGQARLEIGRLHVGDQAPLEPGNQAMLEVFDFIGGPVAGHHDLLVGLVQRIERVEELLLNSFLPGEKLDIVDQQDIGFAVSTPEFGQFIVLDRFDVLVGEFLRRKTEDLQLWVFLEHIVADGVQQVRFAQPHPGVKKQWVVGASRRLGHGQSRRVREVVVVPNHEGGKGVFRVEQLLRRSAGLG